MKPRGPITDTTIKRRALAALRAFGPMRMKTLGAKIEITRERLEPVIEALVAGELVERIPDGMRNGKAMFLLGIQTGPRAAREGFKLPFCPADTLAGFRAAVQKTGFEPLAA